MGKKSSRKAPSSENRASFVKLLEDAKEGHPNQDLVMFVEYLIKCGRREGYPLVQQDLIFLVEVEKFNALLHQHSDLVMLKRKMRTLLDCFICSALDPPLQVDIKASVAEKLRNDGEAFISLQPGEEEDEDDDELEEIFYDAHETLFNQVLPFWAGYQAGHTPAVAKNGKRKQTERKKREKLEEMILANEEIGFMFPLPTNKPRFKMKGLQFTFSFDSGIQWKEWSEENVTENRQSSVKTPRDKKTSRTSNNKNNNSNNSNSKAPNVNNT